MFWCLSCTGWLLVCSDVSRAQVGYLYVLMSLMHRLVTCMFWCLSCTGWLLVCSDVSRAEIGYLGIKNQGLQFISSWLWETFLWYFNIAEIRLLHFAFCFAVTVIIPVIHFTILYSDPFAYVYISSCADVSKAWFRLPGVQVSLLLFCGRLLLLWHHPLL